MNTNLVRLPAVSINGTMDKLAGVAATYLTAPARALSARVGHA